MTTLCQRLLYAQGEELDPGTFACGLYMWVAGKVTTAQLKTKLGLDTGQSAELDEILATRPASPLLLLNVPAYVQWADGIANVAKAWTQGLGFDTPSAMRVGFGLSP